MREMHSSARHRSAHSGSGSITPHLRISRELSPSTTGSWRSSPPLGPRLFACRIRVRLTLDSIYTRDASVLCRRRRDPLQHGEAGSSRRAGRTGAGAAPAGLAHRGSSLRRRACSKVAISSGSTIEQSWWAKAAARTPKAFASCERCSTAHSTSSSSCRCRNIQASMT